MRVALRGRAGASPSHLFRMRLTHPNEGTMHVYRLRGASALAVILAAAACSDSTSAPLTNFYANLTGDQVVPALTNGATGQATVTNTGTAPTVKITMSGLSGTPTRISIMTGLGTVNGTIVADVCGGSAAACASATSVGPVVATMVGANTAATLYTSMKTEGNTYINVFTAAKPAVTNTATPPVTTGGETRGAILFAPLTQ